MLWSMGAKTKPLSLTKVAQTRSAVERVRQTERPTEIQLFVRASGRCEFAGCNEFLLEHHLTLTPGNFAQQAHIVAFSRRGPRANAKLPAAYINSLSNLMLLCPGCHKLIDDNPRLYTVARLKEDKAAHEDRIHHLTGISSNLKTTIVQLKARIAGRTVSMPFSQIAKAVEPRYPIDRKGIVIDLTGINANGADFIAVAREEIVRKIGQLSAAGLDTDEPRHLSVFAMGPIPLLMCLGRELSDKVESDVFQRHRDTEKWTWKTSDAAAEYVLKAIRLGTEQTSVALCLSLSGKIHAEALPTAIDERFTVYELTLGNKQPNPAFLNSRADLTGFRMAYQKALRTIGSQHSGVSELHLFPAIPAPVAVLCGRELLPKIDPKLLVYDADKATDGFTLVLTVN
jgi:hypothetical protein